MTTHGLQVHHPCWAIIPSSVDYFSRILSYLFAFMWLLAGTDQQPLAMYKWITLAHVSVKERNKGLLGYRN